MVFAEVKKIASSFIWAGKRSKVDYDTLIQSVQDVGLRVMDLEERTRMNLLSWIKCIIKKPQCSSAEFIKAMTGAQNILSFLGSKGPLPTFSSPISQFYTEILTLWNKVHNVPPLTNMG